MDADAKPIETLELANGLTLQVFDQSRIVAGDRWRVRLVAQVDIALDRLPAAEAATAEALREEFGDTLTFRQEWVRNFVDAGQKAAVLENLRRSLTDGVARYLAHPDFARRYVLRRLHQRRQQPGRTAPSD